VVKLLRNRHFYYMLLLDALLVGLSYWGAYFLRYEGSLPDFELYRIREALPFIVLIKLSCFSLFGLYRGMWRYTSIGDLVNVIKASVTAEVIMVLIVLYVRHFQGYSRAAFFMDLVLTVLLVSSARLAVRLYFTETRIGIWPLRRSDRRDRRILIVGAGAAAEKVIREVGENPGLGLQPVGLLDDDPDKQGKTIHGVPVLGKVEEVGLFAEECDEIIIAIPSARGGDMRRIVSLCEKTGKDFRTMPALGELIDGRVSVRAIRKVSIDDILGREEVRLDASLLKEAYQDRRVLVTGAGGSIGRELVRQVCRFGPAGIGLLDFSEFNLFSVERRCSREFPGIHRETFLTDIRDREAVERAFGRFQPQVVLHAAAYKHVPLQEEHPWEAVINNVLGTMNVADAARAAGVELFVLVSTDKAVRPTNVMGASKRVAEMYCLALNGDKTRFTAVRFGNVLGSSGSVVPIFLEQIERRTSVTVTHPEVTRYFMSIPEAAQLILQAGAMGRGGETFILDMGKPVKIVDLARDLIRLHGLEPDRDIPIEYIGLRPGEKLYEELITKGEGIVPTDHEKIMVLRGCAADPEEIRGKIASLVAAAKAYDGILVKKALSAVVPEYQPYESHARP